jgi:hypothetical protein
MSLLRASHSPRAEGAAPPAVAPSFSAAPVILGTPIVGTPVAFTLGTASGTPTPTRTQQWTLDGADIGGATGDTYTPISGDATKALRVRDIATNASGNASSTSAPATISAGASPPVFTAQTPPDGTVGIGYGYSYAATGAVSYALASGALPAGLSLNTATGAITGTPTTAATSTFVISATNPNGTTNASSQSVDIVPAAPVGAAQTWAVRSTQPGVLAAHDFTEDAELPVFTRYTTVGGVNPLTLATTPFGGARAVRGRGIGSTITADTPAGVAGDLQWWTVANASAFPDPAGTPYSLIVGNDDYGGQEYVGVHAVNYGANQIRVERRYQDSSTLINNGIVYDWPAACVYTAGQQTIGKGPDASWNRPFCAFPAGKNGRSVADVGASNGSARVVRTWDETQPTRLLRFREGYFGHKSYWDPASGPALYKDWYPNDNVGREGGTRLNAWEGDEIWIQFRAYIPAVRFTSPSAKLMYIQHAYTSGMGQFFWQVGAKNVDQSAGSYGSTLVPLTCFGDGSAPAGGTLSYPQKDGLGWAGVPVQDPASYPLCSYDEDPADRRCWRHPADEWVTYLLHFKFGKDNSPVNPEDPYLGGSNGGASWLGPWFPTTFPSASDTSYRTTFELFVARQGVNTYTKITSRDDFTWFFGDGKWQAGYYFYNPPGLNAIWLTQEMNSYIGSGSQKPTAENHYIDFTQLILSRNWIAPPNDTVTPAGGPAYVSDLAPFARRALTGAYAPTNGKTTLRSRIDPSWGLQAAGASSSINHIDKWLGYSGGIGDPTNGRLYCHGGGHGDSANNGLYYFDVNGTTAPTGFVAEFEQTGTYISANIIAWGGSADFTTYTSYPHPDHPAGVPSAVHSWDNLVLDEANNRIIRIQGSGWNVGQATPSWSWQRNTQRWTKMFDARPSWNSVLSTIFDPVTKTIAWFDDGAIAWVNSTTLALYADFTLAYNLPQNPCSYLDPTRNRVILHCGSVGAEGGIPPLLSLAMNWTARTATKTVCTYSGAVELFDQIVGPAGFYDPVLDRFWFMGGLNTSSAPYKDKVYWINAEDFDDGAVTVFSQTLTGDAPTIPGDSTRDSTMPFKRVLLMSDWRAFFVIPTVDMPAYVIRLPATR